MMQLLPSVYTSQGIGQPPGGAPGGQSLTFSAMDQQALREFVALYASELADLTFNSKPIINTLTMLASENVNAASSVAAAIENHLLTCRPEHKLFALYLLDSIVKNIGEPFVSLFARNLPEVYFCVWQAAPQSHTSLQKLLNTWKGLFPDAMLAAISSRTSFAAQGSSVPRSMAASMHAQQPYPASAGPGLDPRLAAQSYPGATAQPYPAAVAYNVPPSPPLVPYSTGAYPAAVQQQQQQYYAPATAQYLGVAATVAPQQAASYAVPQQQHQQQPHTQLLHASPALPQQQPQQPQQQPQQQQQQQQQQPQQQPQQQEQQQQQQPQQQQNLQHQAMALPGFLSSLYQAGLIQVPGGAIVAAPGDRLQGLTPEELPLKTVDRSKMAFTPERLKARDDGALRELLACSAALRPRHLDAAFLHRRRTRGQQGRTSQQWYVGLDDWVAGTAADATAAPAFFDLQPEQAAPKQAPSVAADDGQPECALSGEAFETFWDDAAEEWRFRDAVRLGAQQAARYGLAEGTIVKVGCLGGDGEEGTGAAPAAAEQATSAPGAEQVAQQASADLAAAAAALEVKQEAGSAAPAAVQPPASAVTAQVGSASDADCEAARDTVGEVAEGGETRIDPSESQAAVSALGGTTAAVKRELEGDVQLEAAVKRVKTEPV